MAALTLYMLFVMLIISPFCTLAMRTKPHARGGPKKHLRGFIKSIHNKQPNHCKNKTSKKELVGCASLNLIHGIEPEKYFAWFNKHVKPTLLSREDRENILEITQKNSLELNQAAHLFLKAPLLFKKKSLQKNHIIAPQKTIQKKSTNPINLKYITHNLTKRELSEIGATATLNNISFEEAKKFYDIHIKMIGCE